MTKLTRHNSFKSLKLSSKSNTTTDAKNFIQLPELEDFLNLLQQKLRPKDLIDIKTVKGKIKYE
jgi:hypothetical protein